ncbi:MAG: glycosyl hydrolase family 65 protein [Sedimentisphaerales bacterium]
MMKSRLSLIIFAALFETSVLAKVGDENEPVRFIGEVNMSSSDYKTGYHDGQMPPAIGVQNFQILRANRTHPEWSDGLGWTYNHAPMLAYFNGRFYCQYLTNPTGENIPPGITMLTCSADGKNWTKPQVIFPIYFTANDDASIVFKCMHQRMGFYIAPNGRFLTFGFYGSNDGNGVGRVVREIYKDNLLGPIYFIRVNDNYKGQANYPLYTTSVDKGFIEACNAFLADKIRRMQWWEEDCFTKDKDDFYRVPWIIDKGRKKPGKAFCFYTRPDGEVIGFFKDRWVTTTKDKGQTWSQPVKCKTLTYGGAKIWAQRLDNGQFALVYNPTNSLARHPLSIATSDDGILFDNLVNVHGEVPLERFWGREKRPGPQYVRGIIEGNGNPPGSDLWVVYSVGKEDIWISRIPVPVKWEVNEPLEDNFASLETGGVVKNWNIYSPRWCPVEIVDFPDRTDKSLMLKDFDPYDYAKAVRVFQKADRQTLSFKLYIESSAQILDIEVVSAKGDRLIQTCIDKNNSFLVSNKKTASLESRKWHSFEFELNSQTRQFAVNIDGKRLAQNQTFCVSDGIPERIIFQTGEYRLADDVQEYKSGDEFKPGRDEPGADEKAEAAVYYIKDFKAGETKQSVLDAEIFKHYVDYFNSIEDEPVVNAVSNAESWPWMKENIPLFECPDKEFEQIYYYRWWTYRKHIKETPDGFVLTEFITPVKHAGVYNTISCALGHHLYEGRWLKNQKYLDDYVKFWFRGNSGGPQPHFHKYSSWLADALYNRYLVSNDKTFLLDLFSDLAKDYQQWEKERLLDNGLFWQYDVRDGMEESISGSRKEKNIRPTINSYMYGNAKAISKIAEMAGQKELSNEYNKKAVQFKKLVEKKLWDKNAKFFKVRLESGKLSDAREEIGFIPWYFDLPGKGFEAAWLQVLDPNGFKALFGLTTAERRHPKFRTHGVGGCEWDGAVWPFATSQTLMAMANVLRNYHQSYISSKDYFDALLTYAKSHRKNDKPYIGEYQDENTGVWLKGDNPRSRYYNHSAFCDLIISGLIGLCPRNDNVISVHPLVPADTWKWFALDKIYYHGKIITIIWDQTGEKYKQGKGLFVYADGKLITHSDSLKKVEGKIK